MNCYPPTAHDSPGILHSLPERIVWTLIAQWFYSEYLSILVRVKLRDMVELVILDKYVNEDAHGITIQLSKQSSDTKTTTEPSPAFGNPTAT